MSSARIVRSRNDHASSSGGRGEVGALRRFFTSPLLLAPLVIFGLIGTGVLVYFYQQFTEMIDAGLRGDIFVRSSGIYAAPPVLRPGLPMKAADLIAHLKRSGYLEAGTTQNEHRGQYAVRGKAQVRVKVSHGGQPVAGAVRAHHERTLELATAARRRQHLITALSELAASGADTAAVEVLVDEAEAALDDDTRHALAAWPGVVEQYRGEEQVTALAPDTQRHAGPGRSGVRAIRRRLATVFARH